MVAAPATTMTRARFRCPVRLRNGRLCDHVVTTIDLEAWEERLNDSVLIECAHCHSLGTLGEFMSGKVVARWQKTS